MNNSHASSEPSEEWDESDAPSALPQLKARTWVMVGIGVAALTVVASYVGLKMADQPIRWRDVGFEVVSPYEAKVTYDVFFYTDADALCHLRAVNVRFAEIGASTQEVYRADGEQQRVSATLATTETANTVIVDSCEILKPSR